MKFVGGIFRVWKGKYILEGKICFHYTFKTNFLLSKKLGAKQKNCGALPPMPTPVATDLLSCMRRSFQKIARLKSSAAASMILKFNKVIRTIRAV